MISRDRDKKTKISKNVRLSIRHVFLRLCYLSKNDGFIYESYVLDVYIIWQCVATDFKIDRMIDIFFINFFIKKFRADKTNRINLLQ